MSKQLEIIPRLYFTIVPVFVPVTVALLMLVAEAVVPGFIGLRGCGFGGYFFGFAGFDVCCGLWVACRGLWVLCCGHGVSRWVQTSEK